MCVYNCYKRTEQCREMDDTINPTIQFVQTDEPCQFPTTLHVTQQPTPVLDHHHLLISTSLPQDHHPIRSASNTRLSSSSQPCSMSADNRESTDKRSEEKMMKKKKVIYREIERQQRQEMAALYGSLRSQLPLEFLKGKRSVADQMHEAAKYIKHIEKKIRELKAKRDELRRIRSDSSVAQSNRPIECSMVSGHEDDAVMVTLSGSTGVEVAINTGVDRGLPLGMVLQVLMGEGLIINCCNSTQADGRLLHSIQCEIIDAEGADATELQQKIKDLKG